MKMKWKCKELIQQKNKMAMEKLYSVRDTHTRSITALGYNPVRREIMMGCEGGEIFLETSKQMCTVCLNVYAVWGLMLMGGNHLFVRHFADVFPLWFVAINIKELPTYRVHVHPGCDIKMYSDLKLYGISNFTVKSTIVIMLTQQKKYTLELIRSRKRTISAKQQQHHHRLSKPWGGNLTYPACQWEHMVSG